jgi:hypothetical protein
MAKHSKHHQCPEGQFGPVYDVAGNSLAKHRRLARNGLSSMTPEQRKAYGEAVEAAVLAKQAQECQRALPALPRPLCASGTHLNDGAAIHKAIRNQQRAALLACPGVERRARTPQQWAAMYEDAIREKRERLARLLAEIERAWTEAA